MTAPSARALTALGLALFSFLANGSPAHAQTFRCQDASGQSQYQQWPCAQAASQRQVLVADARTDAQRNHATDMAEREQKLLRNLSRQNGANQARALPLTVTARRAEAEANPSLPTTDLKRIPRKRDFRAVHKPERHAASKTNIAKARAHRPPSVSGR